MKKCKEKGCKNSKFGSAYIESSCCRKIIRPFTLPGKLYVTFKVVEAWGNNGRIRDSSIIQSQPTLSCLFLPLLNGLSSDDILF